MISTLRFSRFLLLLVIVLLHGCQQKPEPALAVTPRDTTISIKEAFSRLTLDSTVVQIYLSGHPQMSDTAQQLFKNFYNSRNFQYAWFDEHGQTEHAGMLLNLYQRYLEYASDTLRLDHFYKIQRVFSGDSNMVLSAEAIQTMELELTHLFFDYAFAAYIGTTRPEELQWYIPRRKINVIRLLDSVLVSESLSRLDWEPIHPQYRLLRNQLNNFNRLQEAGGWSPIDSLKTAKLQKGMSDPRVLQIKKRLQAVGLYPESDSTLLFTAALQDSVKIIQRTFGLMPDGVVGKSTLQALNVPVAQRIKQLLINMERVRWLPRQPSGDWLLVNIPSFRLQAFSNDSSVLQMKIVVGNAATRTVIFSDELKYIVFSPYWNVPSSIVRSEILPAMRENPAYLSSMRMEKTGTSGVLPLIRQLPGPGNALGQVKFIFPNAYNIYLHDTPAKSYFNESSRAFSHGCIRISQPFLLARYLLRSDTAWTDARIHKAMNAGNEKWVSLRKTVPVFITYFTAWVNEHGRLHFRNDIYGHDERMAEHLFAD